MMYIDKSIIEGTDCSDSDNNNNIVQLHGLYSNLYNNIYSESINAYDNIIKNYPTFENDINNQNWVKHSIDNYDKLNNIEKVAHAFTMMVLTRLL